MGSRKEVEEMGGRRRRCDERLDGGEVNETRDEVDWVLKGSSRILLYAAVLPYRDRVEMGEATALARTRAAFWLAMTMLWS